jgi:nitrogen regulatory protein PII
MLTIVAESSIERQIADELERAGVSGFTSVEARGTGDRGRRSGDWDQNRTIRIETICDAATAAHLAERLLERWGPDYAIVVWLHDVQVVRKGKFDPH